ncbi:peritrophin-1-like [Oppia nitens]|uniref:peritrophin-1-like n=1 Tax=Oppia nitens TaxID=1686743 RepID=UPI0023DC6A0B|nr:peritrophin-1-like [Oppia nitens]
MYKLSIILVSIIFYCQTTVYGLNFKCPRKDIIHTQCMGPQDCLYPHPYRCDQFIHCEINKDRKSARPQVKDCPNGLEWNNNQKICDWPESSTCRQFRCPTKDIIATHCLGPKDCLYTNWLNCNTFIQCLVNADGRTGRPVVMPCPAGLKWNNRDKLCDRPERSTCRHSELL